MKKSVLAAGAAAAGIVFAVTGAAAFPASASHHANANKSHRYVAELAPLNAGQHTVSGGSGEQTVWIPTTDATADIRIKADDFRITVRARGVTPGTLHPQHIHAGMQCPTMADDANHDGFVDVIEGLPKYGPILVSLDSDLNDFGMSLDFPTADDRGTYRYRETASMSALEDGIMGPLDVDTRHVVIHGVDPSTPLPDTVASLPGLPAWATLPVGCGEIELR
jgi:hypothetical protein